MNTKIKMEIVNEAGETVTLILEHKEGLTTLLINGPAITVHTVMSQLEFEALQQLTSLTVPGYRRLTAE